MAEMAFIQMVLSSVVPVQGETLTIGGSIWLSGIANNVPATIIIKKKIDDSVVATLFSGTKNFVAGYNDIETVFAGGNTWDTTSQPLDNYYAELSLDPTVLILTQAAEDEEDFSLFASGTSPVAGYEIPIEYLPSRANVTRYNPITGGWDISIYTAVPCRRSRHKDYPGEAEMEISSEIEYPKLFMNRMFNGSILDIRYEDRVTIRGEAYRVLKVTDAADEFHHLELTLEHLKKMSTSP